MEITLSDIAKLKKENKFGNRLVEDYANRSSIIYPISTINTTRSGLIDTRSSKDASKFKKCLILTTSADCKYTNVYIGFALTDYATEYKPSEYNEFMTTDEKSFFNNLKEFDAYIVPNERIVSLNIKLF